MNLRPASRLVPRQERSSPWGLSRILVAQGLLSSKHLSTVQEGWTLVAFIRGKNIYVGFIWLEIQLLYLDMNGILINPICFPRSELDH